MKKTQNKGQDKTSDKDKKDQHDDETGKKNNLPCGFGHPDQLCDSCQAQM
jgi:hypothetical protein